MIYQEQTWTQTSGYIRTHEGWKKIETIWLYTEQGWVEIEGEES